MALMWLKTVLFVTDPIHFETMSERQGTGRLSAPVCTVCCHVICRDTTQTAYVHVDSCHFDKGLLNFSNLRFYPEKKCASMMSDF